MPIPKLVTSLILCAALALYATRLGVAEDNSIRNASLVATTIADRIGPTDALNSLQQSHLSDGNTFVEQSELDCLIDKEGGGACASAAGIDVLQTLRVMAGLEKFANPHKITLSSIKDQADLLKGRVSNEQFVKLVMFYSAYLNGNNVQIEVQSAANSAYANCGKRWPEKKGPDLIVKSGQLKVLSFTVTEECGNVLGRHFVLLKEQSNDEIEVVDPTNPTKHRRYRIELKRNEQASASHVFLRSPPGVPTHGVTFELNSIFKISFVDNRKTIGSSPTTLSVDGIKTKINETVSNFRGTKDFLSPRSWRKRTADFGLPGLDLPVEFGGSDWKAVDMIEVFRHAGKFNLNFRDVVGGAHIRPLLTSKSPAVLEIVRQVAKGNAYIAFRREPICNWSHLASISNCFQHLDPVPDFRPLGPFTSCLANQAL